ncbi:hypothetical protein EKH57_00765 [Halorubrum sp. BOL3-1]|uniref:hypothetical protein n=1 Tax=Halorubrum sp. BOL3-1 TaxID=2497325 RepID=UPI001004EA04|nr:hypothetical protein [Halorubrum sp. BOL3-1]QAU11437.1 hypothetical protein EKH57_00765 [Halorubrum sp. BOL3-1]
MSSETDADADETADGANHPAAGTTDGGYVHVPGTEVDNDGTADSGGDAADSDGAADGDGPRERVGTAGEPTAEGFGRKGWALTAVLFTCVLVIPGIIYLYPYAAGAFGLTFFATYLALPFVPAVLLGLVAVWSMTAATADGEE